MTQLDSQFAPGELIAEDVLKAHLRLCGTGVKIFRGARLVPANRISVGDHSQIDEGVFLFAGAGIEIGRYVHFAFHSSVSGGGECVVGDFAGIGIGVRLVTGTDLVDRGGLTNPTVPERHRTVHRGRVTIGAHAVIFTNAVVLPDVTVGEGAVVSAGSVVHHDLKPWGIYAGHPLVQVGVRERDGVLKLAEEFGHKKAQKAQGREGSSEIGSSERGPD